MMVREREFESRRNLIDYGITKMNGMMSAQIEIKTKQ